MLCPCRRLLPRSPPPPVLEMKLNLWGAGGAWLRAAKPFREGRGRRSWRHSASNGRKWPVAMGRGACSQSLFVSSFNPGVVFLPPPRPCDSWHRSELSSSVPVCLWITLGVVPSLQRMVLLFSSCTNRKRCSSLPVRQWALLGASLCFQLAASCHQFWEGPKARV